MAERARESPTGASWRGGLLFFLLVYAASVAIVDSLAARAGGDARLLVPLFPCACAGMAFWSRGRWKSRAAGLGAKLAMREKTLTSLGHEAANAATAVRANLISFRLTNPGVPDSAHLDEIDLAINRIASAIHKSQRCG
jgi:hypothetical protein